MRAERTKTPADGHEKWREKVLDYVAAGDRGEEPHYVGRKDVFEKVDLVPSADSRQDADSESPVLREHAVVEALRVVRGATGVGLLLHSVEVDARRIPATAARCPASVVCAPLKCWGQPSIASMRRSIMATEGASVSTPKADIICLVE